MNRLTGKLMLATLLAAAVALVPATASAQTNSTTATNTVTTTNTTKTARAKPRSPYFQGKIIAIDQTNKTITAGPEVKRVYTITSTTKLTKAGKPAAFEDFVVGDQVGISYAQTADGKFEAKTIRTVPPRAAKKSPAAAAGATPAATTAPDPGTPPPAPK